MDLEVWRRVSLRSWREWGCIDFSMASGIGNLASVALRSGMLPVSVSSYTNVGLSKHAYPLTTLISSTPIAFVLNEKPA